MGLRFGKKETCMAEDQLGQRPETKVPWTKIFTGFKVALDVRKLLLAAAGIFAMNLGWVVLSWVFFNTRSMPKAEDYLQSAKDESERQSRYKDFKTDRKRWNLLNELAGKSAVPFDAGDVANDYQEYEQLQAWHAALVLGMEPVVVGPKDVKFVGLKEAYAVVAPEAADKDAINRLINRPLRVLDVKT